MKVLTFHKTALDLNSRCWPSLASQKHPSEYEFHYIVKGRGVFKNGKKSHPFSDNTLFFTPPGILHSLNFKPGCGNVFYYCSLFTTEKDDEKLISLIEQNFKKGYLRIGAYNNIYFDEMSQKIFSNNTALHQSGLHAFSSFLHELAKGKQNLYVGAAVRIMHDNPASALNLDALSQKLGLNKSYFIHLFKKRIGVSPMQYFIRLKIDTACHLLKHSRMPIYAIARHLHFVDEFYFSRMFKRIMGVPPKIYRA